MGTRYVRNAVVPDTVDIKLGETKTYKLPHIYSEIEIGTTLRINLRQPTQSTLPFVTFNQQTTLTEVRIETAG